MSQKKTKVPGMENAANNAYKRDSFEPNRDAGKQRFGDRQTQYPGMKPLDESNQEERHKPIAGFLFSVSRTSYGEYWPLYLGKNTIGCGSDNSVCLSEGSVSINHALLVIQQVTNPDKTFAILQDTASSNGTFVNHEPLLFGSTEKCKNGDVLRFGGSYECLLILFDVRELGLKKAENFIAEDAEEDMEEVDMDGPYRRSNETRPGGDQFFNAGMGGTQNPIDGGPMFRGPKHKTVGIDENIQP